MSFHRLADSPSKTRLLKEMRELRQQLAEAEQTIQAIRNGQVDALIVNGPQGEQVFSLTGADYLYRIIVETMNEAALTLSELGTVVFCNRRFCELMLMPMETVIGREFLSFVPSPQHAQVKDLIARARSLPVLRTSLLSAEGQSVPVQLCVSPLQAGEGPSVCLVASDLSELEATVSELTQSQERMRALATELNLTEQRERKRLAGELHDHLQQILVLGKLTIGQSKREMPASQSIAESIKKVDNLLSNALAYTRTLVAELSPPVLRTKGLVAGIKWLAEEMKKHELTVRVRLSNSSEVSLPEDQVVLLFQSVRELLINASKHAKTEEVWVSLEPQPAGVLRIVVSDQGAGFDVSAEAHMSQRGLSSKFGLFSINERMRALGGSFVIQSAPGKGTVATLMLRLAQTEDIMRPTSNQSVVGASASIASRSSSSFMNERIRLVLVDDHAMVRQGLRAILDSYADLEVVAEAGDGEEAIAVVERLRPNVVIMDVNMPKKNGIDATRDIKALFSHIMVIGVSVNASGDHEQAMLRAGASVLLTKEAAVEHLHVTIRDAMKLSGVGVTNSAR